MSEGSAPASFVQRAMWAVAQRHRGAPLNVMILPWRIRGPLDVALLEAALGDVIARHPTLRTRLKLNAGQLLQIIAVSEPTVMPVVAVQGASQQARTENAIDLLREQGRQPLDLTTGPPLRLLLLRLDATDHMLCIYVHHAMCDGWSSRIIMRDFAAFYEARTQGRTATLAPSALQYAEFAEWQIRTHESGGFATEIDYWRSELKNLPSPTELPVTRARKGNRDWSARSPQLALSADTLAALKAYARANKSSLFAVMLSAVAVLLHNRTGVNDLVIGVSTVNRRTQAEMQMVGCVTNLLPARIRLCGNLGFRDLVGQTHATVRRLLAYGRIPLEVILRELAGSLSRGPVFPVWCQSREPSKATVLEPGGLSFAPFEVDRAAILCELEADLIETASGVDCVFAHRPSLFDAPVIASLMADFGSILQLVSRENGLRVDDLCLRACAAHRS